MPGICVLQAFLMWIMKAGEHACAASYGISGNLAMTWFLTILTAPPAPLSAGVRWTWQFGVTVTHLMLRIISCSLGPLYSHVSSSCPLVLFVLSFSLYPSAFGKQMDSWVPFRVINNNQWRVIPNRSTQVLLPTRTTDRRRTCKLKKIIHADFFSSLNLW